MLLPCTSGASVHARPKPLQGSPSMLLLSSSKPASIDPKVGCLCHALCVLQVVEAERKVLVWERRVQLEKEMQVGHTTAVNGGAGYGVESG